MNLRRALVIALGLLTLGVFGLALYVWLAGRHERARRVPAIVVLGAQVRPDGSPSPALQARMQKAVTLYRAGMAPLLVLSGGEVDGRPAEARVMAGLAEAAGIPPEALLLEASSRSTFENARLTAELLRERDIDQAVLVSDPFHLLRARQQFRRAGIDVFTSPARRDHLSRAGRVYWVMREGFALLMRPWLLLVRRPSRTR